MSSCGRLAQSVERVSDKHKVEGSSPSMTILPHLMFPQPNLDADEFWEAIAHKYKEKRPTRMQVKHVLDKEDDDYIRSCCYNDAPMDAMLLELFK